MNIMLNIQPNYFFYIFSPQLKVPTSDKPGFVNFCKVLLNRCQEEFEKDRDDDEFLEKKQKELEAATHVRHWTVYSCRTKRRKKVETD